jgi:hypothetical protein
VLQKQPDFNPKAIEKPYQGALQLAKDALRLEYKANVNDPAARYRAGWWECLSEHEAKEQVRREHRALSEAGVSEPDQLYASLGWKHSEK